MENLKAKDYRLKASEICKKQTNNLALIYLIYLVIIAVLGATSFIGVGAIVGVATSGAFILSFCVITIKVNKEEKVEIKDLFVGFYDLTKSICIYLLQSLFIMLWLFLFIIPGIIKALSYSMAFYVHLDNKELGANDCIKKSQEIMMGNKYKFFCLLISYLGWFILCGLTCGILTLWVMPKVEQAKYLFYKNIVGEKIEREKTSA